MNKCFIVFISILYVPNSSAQKITGNLDQMDTEFNVDENMLMETTWRYVQTTHATSGEAIHTASDDYDYYLNLKYLYFIFVF